MRLVDGLKRLLGLASPDSAHLRCPYCGGDEWIRGPSGGSGPSRLGPGSTNIMCRHCDHWFNWHRGLAPMDDLHQVGRDRRPVRE